MAQSAISASSTDGRERIIPSKLAGTFNETYVAGLDDLTNKSRGAYAIIDPHNVGRYYGKVITDLAGFKAWWTTVAERYADNDWNEYHDMDNALVGQFKQGAIDAFELLVQLRSTFSWKAVS